MEIGEKKIFDKDAAYERWDQKNQRRGNDKYFYEEEREESYLRELKGRIQNNTSGFLKVVLTALIVLAQVCIVMFFTLIFVLFVLLVALNFSVISSVPILFKS